MKPKEGGLVPLVPVVSSLIKDKRAHPDLNIVDISDDTSPVEGKNDDEYFKIPLHI